MEYEARTIKWYWLALVIIYSIVAVYLVIRANPFLYSQGTLKARQEVQTSEKLQPWPPPGSQFELDKEPSGGGSSWPFLSAGNLNMTSPEVTRNKSYTEFKAYPLDVQFEGEPQVLNHSSRTLILRDATRIFNFDAEGGLRWSYGLPEGAELKQALVDSILIYLIRQNGSLTALSLETGRPQWTLQTERPVLGEAWLESELLILPVEKMNDPNAKKSSKKITSSLMKIDRGSGTPRGSVDGFDFKQAFKEVAVLGTGLRLIYSGSQITAISKDLGKGIDQLWSTNLPENISRELVVANSSIFAVTEGKRLYVLSAKKKGDVSFDIDLDINPGGNVTYLPEMERLAYLGENGVLRVVDLKKENMAWKFDLSIKGPLREVWSSRLKGAYIQEFGMKWLHKGWTLWSPCRASQFCVYNPDRGQLIQRIELSGTPMAMPVVLNEKIFALLKQPTGTLAIAHLLEPAELRKAEAAAEAAAAQSAPEH